MTEIQLFTGDRRKLMPLLLLADEPEPLAKYIDDGEAVVATDGDEIVGVVLTGDVDDATVEAKNVGVAEHRHGQGIGRAMMEHVVERARAAGKKRVVVATVTADTGNIRFYQRCGFRLLRIERDVFTPENGYPPDEVNGIPMRDQVWFDLDL